MRRDERKINFLMSRGGSGKTVQGSLYLIPNTLEPVVPGVEMDYTWVIPEGVAELVHGISEYFVENIRSTRRFLRLIGHQGDFTTMRFYDLKRLNQTELELVLKKTERGTSFGIISEAGVPAVADPGGEVVMAAHRLGIRVVPLVGPNSILLALMASGLNGQSFLFHGYLPIDSKHRVRKLKALESRSYSEAQTQIFIETPYRNKALLADILEACQENTLLCIACDLTTSNEFIMTETIAWWRKRIPDINRRPAVFLIGGQ